MQILEGYRIKYSGWADIEHEIIICMYDSDSDSPSTNESTKQTRRRGLLAAWKYP